jgi:hypothetical protein
VQAGGCCDCGDEDAWEPAGFCGRHGKDGDDPLSNLPPTFIASSRGLMHQAVAFTLHTLKAVMAAFDLTTVGEQLWAAGHTEFRIVVHNDDIHDARWVVPSLGGGQRPVGGPSCLTMPHQVAGGAARGGPAYPHALRAREGQPGKCRDAGTR